MKYQNPENSPKQQRGVASLAISLIILVIMTIMTLYSGRVSLLKQRISGNEVRAKEALANADALIESGILFLRENRGNMDKTTATGWLNAGNVRWADCVTGTTTLPCGNGTINIYPDQHPAMGPFIFYSNPNNPAGLDDWDVVEVSGATANSALYLIANCEDSEPDGTCDDMDPAAAGVQPAPRGGANFTLVAQNTANDATGNAFVQQSVFLYQILADPPDAPLVVAGGIDLGGAFNVAGNPNGGGEGVPLAVWSEGNSDGAGSYKTCHVEEFERDGGCTADTAISSTGNEGIDILDVEAPNPHEGENPDSTYFPPDMFEYVFGIPEASYQDIKDQSEPVADCGNLDAGSSGMYWRDGDCALQGDVGSQQNPVLLVVADGNLTINANADIYGLVFAFDVPAQAPAGAALSLTINGGATVHGSLMANYAISLGAGTYNAVYDATALENLVQDNSTRGVGKIPGTWSDNY